MVNMNANREQDREHLMELPKEKLIDLLFTHIRDIWSEDGLYFIGIEKKCGTDMAIEIDREVWAVMGKIEARRLKDILDINGTDIAALVETLKHSDWWLDLEKKEYEVDGNRAVFRNKECRVQLTRIKKGLGEFGCKNVRWGFLKNFVKEFNPNILVNCLVCPPDKHPEDVWCEWEFSIKE